MIAAGDGEEPLSSKDLLHRLAFGQLVNQLVEVTDLAHQRLLNRFMVERPANKSQVEISDLGERQKDNTKSSR